MFNLVLFNPKYFFPLIYWHLKVVTHYKKLKQVKYLMVYGWGAEIKKRGRKKFENRKILN